MNRHDNSDSIWTLLGSIIGLLLLTRLALALLVNATHAGLAGLAAIGLLAAVGLSLLDRRRSTPAGRHTPLLAPLWRRLRRRPAPLGGEVRWGGLRALWRAHWTGRNGWPIGVYYACGGLLRITVCLLDRDQTLGTLLIAPVGQGKTDSVDVPIVLSEARIRSIDKRHSLILLDPKGDILAKCAGALRASHELLVWNPSQPNVSTIAFNPLAWVPADPKDVRFSEAIETAARIYLAATATDDAGAPTGYTTDPFWPKMVGAALKGILLHLAAFRPSLTLIDVADYIAAVTPEEMVRHLTTRPRTGAARLRGTVLREMLYNERVRGAVLAELAERTVLLTDPRLTRTLAPDTLPSFDLDAFLARPTVLVLQVGALGDAMLPLLSVVTATIQAELVRRTRDGGSLPRGVRFILDEAGVVGHIHGLDTGIAMLRSANVGYLVTIQDREQLVVNYGQHRAKIIVSNLTHRLVLGGTTDDDAAWVCGHLGKRNAYRDLPGMGGMGEESWHYTKEEWPLLRPDQLRRMRFQMVVDSSHVPPLRLRLKRYRAGH